jgi:hypothetical protein
VTGQEALFGGLAHDISGQLYSIDGTTTAIPTGSSASIARRGAGTVVGPTNFNWNFRCLSLNPASGVLYGCTDNNLYTMNTVTGAADTDRADLGGHPT